MERAEEDLRLIPEDAFNVRQYINKVFHEAVTKRYEELENLDGPQLRDRLNLVYFLSEKSIAFVERYYPGLPEAGRGLDFHNHFRPYLYMAVNIETLLFKKGGLTPETIKMVADVMVTFATRGLMQYAVDDLNCGEFPRPSHVSLAVILKGAIERYEALGLGEYVARVESTLSEAREKFGIPEDVYAWAKETVKGWLEKDLNLLNGEEERVKEAYLQAKAVGFHSSDDGNRVFTEWILETWADFLKRTGMQEGIPNFSPEKEMARKVGEAIRDLKGRGGVGAGGLGDNIESDISAVGNPVEYIVRGLRQPPVIEMTLKDLINFWRRGVLAARAFITYALETGMKPGEVFDVVYKAALPFLKHIEAETMAFKNVESSLAPEDRSLLLEFLQDPIFLKEGDLIPVEQGNRLGLVELLGGKGVTAADIVEGMNVFAGAKPFAGYKRIDERLLDIFESPTFMAIERVRTMMESLKWKTEKI